MNFSFNLTSWVNNMVPLPIRNAVMLAYVRVLATPLSLLWADAQVFYAAKLAEIAPNLLTDILQAYLRTKYPNNASGKCWVYNQYELTPQVYLQYIGGHMLQENDYSIGETFTQEYDYYIDEHKPLFDYIIVVPTAYNSTANSSFITSFLTKYKPAGKSFTHQYLNIP